MKTVWMKQVLAIVLATVCLAVQGRAETVDLNNVEAVIARELLAVRPNWKVTTVNPTPISGLYQVSLQGGMILYVSADGSYIIDGELYAHDSGQLTSLTENFRKAVRASSLKTIKREDMVIFSPPPPQATKAVLYVFTDVDCGYCQKLHQEVPQLNGKGIEVRYLAWPRAGFDSDTYRKMVTVWCAKGKARQQLLTRMKNREEVPLNLCEDNPVADQFLLGQELGVRGTPALVFEDGTLEPGYIPAARLVPMLLQAASRKD